MKIINYVKALLPRVEREKVLEDLRVTTSELDQIVLPNYRQAADFFKANKLQSSDNKDLSDVFYRKTDLNGMSKQSSFVNDIAHRMPFVRDNIAYVQEQIEILLERDVINEGLTAKKAILIRAAEQLSFLSRFSVDLLNLIYVNEAIEADSNVVESMQLAPAIIKHVQVNFVMFAQLLGDYGIPTRDFEKIVGKVPDVVISSKNANSIVGIYKEQDIDPFTSGYVPGFVGNPIYHIRLAVAEWQAGRYKASKDKKKVLELRLLHLKLAQEKKSNPQVEQEIQYIQGRIDRMERYQREVEESLEIEA